MDDCTGGRPSEQSTRALQLRLTGLVHARAILERRGASKTELDSFSREAAYIRWRLASRSDADAA